ncbi:hypothetical protein [Streptomyces sp. RKAG293]|uniref:hypothetical protein n=1 Tax=Streptomyces sp. RKAG293 TaxID=2893403 RepID=UPI0020337155|nr:hypothetical protein [Streptomyces sp. RKAG293]MCM2420226.1 hypothetical protein [Streptomyces sp. RKAG293]
MSDYLPDENDDWNIAPPATGPQQSGYNTYPYTLPPDYKPEQHRIEMQGEAHDDSRIYMAGRDQYVTQGLDIGALQNKLRKAYYESLSGAAPLFSGWLLRACWTSGPSGWHLIMITFFFSFLTLCASIFNGFVTADDILSKGSTFSEGTGMLVYVISGIVISLASFSLLFFFGTPQIDSYANSFVAWLGNTPVFGEYFS